MPSSATITAFYTFSPGSKARSTHLNNNFGVFRGHLLPVEPNTETASDQTYDLGVSDYRWSTAYVSNISVSISTGASQIMSGTTAGGFKWKPESAATTTAEFADGYFLGENDTPMDPTSSADYGGIAVSSALNITITADGFIAGSTCTIVSHGRPVFVGLAPVGGTSGDSHILIRAIVPTDSAFPQAILRMQAYYESASTQVFSDEVSNSYFSNTIGVSGPYLARSPGGFGRVFTPAAGTHVFQLRAESTSTTYGVYRIELHNLRLVAYEL